MMHAKGYCRDTLHRDAARPDRFLHSRLWTSPEMRSEAQADPEVHRYWQMLPGLCNIPLVYESLRRCLKASCYTRQLLQFTQGPRESPFSWELARAGIAEIAMLVEVVFVLVVAANRACACKPRICVPRGLRFQR